MGSMRSGARRPSSTLLGTLMRVLNGNVIKLGVSLLVLLLIPRVIGVEEYGFFQLYLFCANYLSLLHFGWIDGIGLRYGGRRFSGLTMGLLSGQFLSLLGLQIVFSVIILVVAFFNDSTDLGTVALFLAVTTPVTVLRSFLQALVQATFRMRLYSNVLISEQVLFGILVLGLTLSGRVSYVSLMQADVARGVFALGCFVIWCRSAIFVRPFLCGRDGRFVRGEILANVSSGIFVTVSFLTSALVLGIVRMGVGWAWGIDAFGQLSLSLNISSFALVLLTAAGLTVFPLLKRRSDASLKRAYSILRTSLSFILPLVLVSALPLTWFVEAWLPEYEVTAQYLPILLPIVVFDGLLAILYNPFLRALRMERLMLLINVAVAGLAFVAVWVFSVLSKSFLGLVVCIPALSLARCLLADFLVSGRVGVHGGREVVQSGVVTAGFGIVSWFGGVGFGVLFPVAASLILLRVRWGSIATALRAVRDQVGR